MVHIMVCLLLIQSPNVSLATINRGRVELHCNSKMSPFWIPRIIENFWMWFQIWFWGNLVFIGGREKKLEEPVNNSFSLQLQDNKAFLAMISHVLSVDGFYFSTTYDLTHTLQRLANTSPEFQEMSLLERVRMFVPILMVLEKTNKHFH